MTRRSLLVLAGVVALVACASGNPPEPAPAPASVPINPPGARQVVSTGVSISTTRWRPRTDDASVEAFRPEVAAFDSAGECNVTRMGGGNITMVSVYYPVRSAALTSASMTFDSAGHVIRYLETRHITPEIPVRGLKREQLDSASEASRARERFSTLQLDYTMNQAVFSNTGGHAPTDGILTTVRRVENVPRYGPLTAHIARLRAVCGV